MIPIGGLLPHDTSSLPETGLSSARQLEDLPDAKVIALVQLMETVALTAGGGLQPDRKTKLSRNRCDLCGWGLPSISPNRRYDRAPLTALRSSRSGSFLTSQVLSKTITGPAVSYLGQAGRPG